MRNPSTARNTSRSASPHNRRTHTDTATSQTDSAHVHRTPSLEDRGTHDAVDGGGQASNNTSLHRQKDAESESESRAAAHGSDSGEVVKMQRDLENMRDALRRAQGQRVPVSADAREPVQGGKREPVQVEQGGKRDEDGVKALACDHGGGTLADHHHGDGGKMVNGANNSDGGDVEAPRGSAGGGGGDDKKKDRLALELQQLSAIVDSVNKPKQERGVSVSVNNGDDKMHGSGVHDNNNNTQPKRVSVSNGHGETGIALMHGIGVHDDSNNTQPKRVSSSSNVPPQQRSNGKPNGSSMSQSESVMQQDLRSKLQAQAKNLASHKSNNSVSESESPMPQDLRSKLQAQARKLAALRKSRAARPDIAYGSDEHDDLNNNGMSLNAHSNNNNDDDDDDMHSLGDKSKAHMPLIGDANNVDTSTHSDTQQEGKGTSRGGGGRSTSLLELLQSQREKVLGGRVDESDCNNNGDDGALLRRRPSDGSDDVTWLHRNKDASLLQQQQTGAVDDDIGANSAAEILPVKSSHVQKSAERVVYSDYMDAVYPVPAAVGPSDDHDDDDATHVGNTSVAVGNTSVAVVVADGDVVLESDGVVLSADVVFEHDKRGVVRACGDALSSVAAARDLSVAAARDLSVAAAAEPLEERSLPPKKDGKAQDREGLTGV
jgi:hypothetical protein